MRGDIHLLYPIQFDSSVDDGDIARNNEERSPLLSGDSSQNSPSEANPFVHPRRPRRDVDWLCVLVVAIFAMVTATAVLQYRNRDAVEATTDNDFLNDPANCAKSAIPAPTGVIVTYNFYKSFVKPLWHDLKWLTVAMVVGTLVLRLFEWRAGAAVKVVAVALVVGPLCAGAYLIAFSSLEGLGIVLFGHCIIGAVCVGIWRAKLPLLGRLISIACSVIADNPNLFWLAILTQVILAIADLPFSYAASAGSLAVLKPNSFAHPPDSNSTCLNRLTEQPTACCQWQAPPRVLLLMATTWFVRSWLMAAIIEAQTFLISGVVCQWYFAPVSAASCRGNVARSGKHMMSSLGTLAMAGLVNDWVRFLRLFTYVNDRPLDWTNPLAYVCGCICCPLFCLSCCTKPCFDGITKYATHRAAISGYSYRDSNSVMRGTLRRQRMNHIGMGWVPPFILIFSRNTLTSTISWVIASFATSSSSSSSSSSSDSFLEIVMNSMNDSWARIHDTGYNTSRALCLAGPLLLAIIDSLYVCFALDLEQQTCTKKAVHDVFTHKPRIGPIFDDAPRIDSYDMALVAAPPVPQEQGAGAGVPSPMVAPPPTQHA